MIGSNKSLSFVGNGVSIPVTPVSRGGVCDSEDLVIVVGASSMLIDVEGEPMAFSGARAALTRTRGVLAEEKMALLVKVEQERADSADYKASCHWAVKYLEGGKNNHFAGLDDFRQRVEGLLEKQEEKLRKLSIEYDEELYPHMLSAIAERRWLISHGLRLAAMSTLESQEVKQSFGDVVKCALARGKAEAVEELHEKKLLTVPAAQVPGYNHNAYEELVAAMEAMKLLELPHIAQLERDQDYPIGVIMAGLTLARHATEGAEAQPDYFLKPDVAQLQVPIFACPRDILNPFALEKEIPLKESLEAHAIRLAKKKGVKGKAILCGVGAAHIPRSDGVPVSVATVSPKDSELLGKLTVGLSPTIILRRENEELREFTSEYYIPSALHPEVPAASASIADFPGSLPRDERPPPGSYSIEDAELINENRIPINTYSEAFLCHMGISHNYFQSLEEVPTFIGDDGR
ncbi:hypothetical protein Tco_0882548, partial [Tanacetum coccineum]